MRGVLIDGSNVALHTAAPGKLKSLDCLAHVVHALISDGIVPYTVFDASFRYRIADGSPARREFDRLTREVKQYFQMSPRGEKADLFLLELALATEYPIISDDTFQEFGGVEDGAITYQGTSLAVYNFQVIAGTVVIPDLRIRFRYGKGHDLLDNVADTLAKLEAEKDADVAVGSAPVADSKRIEADAATVQAIRAVIDAYLNGGSRPLGGLGLKLADYRQAFVAESGVGKKGRRVWFGFATLSDFVRATYPDYRVDGDMIAKSAPA